MKLFKMVLLIFLILCVGGIGAIFLFQRSKSSLVVEENGAKRPVRIMLFTCQYGSGHKMATQIIIESLPDCEIQVVDIYDEPLASLDLMRAWAPEFSNERIYNELIKKEQNQLLNVAGKIAPQFLLLQKKNIEKLLIKYVSKDKPDMLISCVPLVNFALLSTADKLDIPLLVITTDIDISAFCFGLKEDLKENKNHFRMTVPYEKTELFDHHRFASLQASFQYGFGYPTRRAFSEMPKQAVLNQLRDEYEIQEDEHVILVMMGGNAGQAARAYANLLMQMDNEAIDRIVGKENTRNKIHLICLCGDTSRAENMEFMKSLNACNHESLSRVRIHGCPGTSKIGELVSLPELCAVISKPGGSTVNEMIKKKVPMIYHTNREPLDWEKGNMEYGESRGFGKRFLLSNKSKNNDLSVFTDFLTDAFALRKAMSSGKVPVPEADIDFSLNLRKTVRDMTSQEPTSQQ